MAPINPLSSLPGVAIPGGKSYQKSAFEELQLPQRPAASTGLGQPYHFESEVRIFEEGGSTKWVHIFGTTANVFNTEPYIVLIPQSKNRILDRVADEKGSEAAQSARDLYDEFFTIAAKDWARFEPTKKQPRLEDTEVYKKAMSAQLADLLVVKDLVRIDKTANDKSSQSLGTRSLNNCSEITKHMWILESISVCARGGQDVILRPRNESPLAPYHPSRSKI